MFTIDRLRRFFWGVAIFIFLLSFVHFIFFLLWVFLFTALQTIYPEDDEDEKEMLTDFLMDNYFTPYAMTFLQADMPHGELNTYLDHLEIITDDADDVEIDFDNDIEVLESFFFI